MTVAVDIYTMACANMDLGIDSVELQPMVRRREAAATQQYQATELVPSSKPLLHDLLRKQPAVLGSVQVVSGLLSVGIGIIFAVYQSIGASLFSLFRLSQLTGMLFIIAGIVSNMLFKYPELLSVSLMVNCACLIVAFLATPMIIVDLVKWNPYNAYLRMEMFELCILLLESSLSVVLCVWFIKEKRKHSK